MISDTSNYMHPTKWDKIVEITFSILRILNHVHCKCYNYIPSQGFLETKKHLQDPSCEFARMFRQISSLPSGVFKLFAKHVILFLYNIISFGCILNTIRWSVERPKVCSSIFLLNCFQAYNSVSFQAT